MEEEIERNKDHPRFAPLYFPAELHRHQALACDLEYFYGPNWQSQVTCSQATQRYVDRIHQVGREDPVLLVAHAYTRYMGDLSGGQVLRKVAQRALKLPPTGEGVKFYQFDAIHSAKAFKQLYRSRMNELDLDMDIKKRLVEEAVKAFQFNMEVKDYFQIYLSDMSVFASSTFSWLHWQVFEELEEIGKTIQDELLDAGMPVHGTLGGDISKCPYYAAKMGIHQTHHVLCFRFIYAYVGVLPPSVAAASGGTAYIGQLAMAVLRHPTGQVLFATWFAALAGLAAWYLMWAIHHAAAAAAAVKEGLVAKTCTLRWCIVDHYAPVLISVMLCGS